MKLDDALTQVAVVGAAGKMGSGIALLLLEKMAQLSVEESNQQKRYSLFLIDTNDVALLDTKKQLENQILRYAEKNINHLRKLYSYRSDLISNREVIDTFVSTARDMIYLDSDLIHAKKANLVFESIVEDVEKKIELFKKFMALQENSKYYFSNTSAIPIKTLSTSSGMDGNLIGFHFYNPPPVQKVLELVSPPHTSPELIKLAKELAAQLGKIVVESADIAGFIGNGYLIRELLFAVELVKEMQKNKHISIEEAIFKIDHISQSYLIRPMGIFQLINYIGIDTVINIAAVMTRYLNDPRFSKFSRAEISYKPSPLSEEDSNIPTWKMLVKNKDAKKIIRSHLEWLEKQNSPDAIIAKKMLHHLKKIADELIHLGVIRTVSALDIVLKEGFHHLYGVEEIYHAQKSLCDSRV